jgi:branched-chain amino acid aminotransferase
MYPWVYVAQYTGSGEDEYAWEERFEEKPHKSPEEEAALSPDERQEVLASRNSFPDLPLVNYTTQYGMGCFEGLKAFPQKDGSLKVFRPDENGKRMYRSMKGLMMPAYPGDLFVDAVIELLGRNLELGFTVEYDAAWEERDFVDGHAVYIRPFTYSEPGIGLNLSTKPWVVMVATPVGSYFDTEASTRAITTNKVRATRGGTGWIKCDSNYVIPTLVKKQVQAQGYMEAIFLDADEGTYVEEGSSCNIFFYLKNGTLVTPNLEDRILPGINRKSVLTLAADLGIETEERRISIEEAMSEGTECFVTGTAAGVAYIESIEHEGRVAVYNDGKIGELTQTLRRKLKGIQYGAEDDAHGWMIPVPAAVTST